MATAITTTAASLGASGNYLLDGELEIVNITEDLYDQAVELYRNCFMKYEVVCIATNLLGSQQAVKELESVMRVFLKDGISFAARNRQTKELIAIAVNKIVSPKLNHSLDELFATFKSKEMHCVGEFLERMENTVSIFEEWNIDCAMEIEFLSTRADYNGRGLASALSKYSIEFARQMASGTIPANIKLDDSIKGMQPKAVCAIFTGCYSQRVGERLGFETVIKVPYTDFTFDGQTFAARIDPIHKYSAFAAMKL